MSINAEITNASVTFELQRKTVENTWIKVEQEGLTNPVEMTVGLTPNTNAWKAEWNDLPKYELVSGTAVEIEYRVVETSASHLGELTPAEPVEVTSAQPVSIDNNLPVDLLILKVDADGMTTPLEGAVFTIQQIDETASALSLIGSPVQATTTGTIPGETGEDGLASFEDLKPGYYIITETKLPSGYIQTGTGSFYVKVEAGEVKLVERDGTGWKESDGNEQLIFTSVSVSGPAVATVGNTSGAELPYTGGPGTRLFTILGSILILGAGVLLWRRWRLI